jgi:hypothetical protein
MPIPKATVYLKVSRQTPREPHKTTKLINFKAHRIDKNE